MAARAALLVVGVVAALAACAAAQAVVPYTNKTSIRVCTSETTPMVYCNGRAPQDYAGYEIDIFRRVAAELGWEPSMLEWSCLDWDDMLASLKSGDGRCDIAVAGIDVKYADVAEGVTFTWPSYRNGLAILTSTSKGPSYSIWSFLKAFEWQVWVVTLVTVLVVPFIIWAIDWLAYCWRGPGWPAEWPASSRSLSEYFWQSVSRPMWQRNMQAISWAANVVVTIYSFMIVIIFALYVGYATSNLTTSQLDSEITGLDTLPGKAVGTWAPYSDKLQKYGVAASTYPWNNAADEQAMVRDLKSGALQALVLDQSFLTYLSASDCNVVVVGTSFEGWEQATAFPAGFNNSDLMDAYNAALTNITDVGVLEELQAADFTPADAPVCSEASTSTAITFHQVAGLWVVQAAAVGLGLLIIALHLAHHHWAKPALAKSKTVQSAKGMLRTATSKMASASSGSVKLEPAPSA